MYRGLVGALALAALGGWFVDPAHAQVSEATRCEILKLKSVVKEFKDKAQCYERSLKGGVPVSQACFARAEEKRTRIFTRAEERGACKTQNDGPMIGSRIDAYLQELTQAIAGPPEKSPTTAKAADAKDAAAKQAKPSETPADSAAKDEATKAKEE